MKDPLWSALNDLLEAGEPCVLATVVRAEGSVPRQPGAKMIVSAGGAVGTVGGGALEHAVMAAAREVLASGVPRLLCYRLKPDLGMACGGSADVFLDPLGRVHRLHLFGAGHIGQALAGMAAAVGFAVTVVDDRPELASRERFPRASALVHSFDPQGWEGLAFDEQTYCVVVTPSHVTDTAVAGELLARPCRYVGMIGSKNKRRAVERALAEAGLPAERLARLHTPVGLAIGAQTPEEIALAIAAELVQARAGSASDAAGSGGEGGG